MSPAEEARDPSLSVPPEADASPSPSPLHTTGSKELAEYTRPRPQLRLIPWGWILFGVFVVADLIVFYLLHDWAQDAVEAHNLTVSAGPAGDLGPGAISPMPVFARLLMAYGMIVLIVISQILVLLVMYLRR